jgi:hypothetical protein
LAERLEYEMKRLIKSHKNYQEVKTDNKNSKEIARFIIEILR